MKGQDSIKAGNNIVSAHKRNSVKKENIYSYDNPDKNTKLATDVIQ